jgi:ABC-2 type transport system ATP-binding protein
VASDEAHILAEGLRKRYRGADSDAVHDLSLRIERGSIYGILGPNGAGKTTTLSMLCGLIQPDAGTVRYGGGRSPAEMRRRIGLVPQHLALYERLTARENLSFFGRLYGVSGRSLARRAEEVLDVAGLRDRAEERVERYSTGMKRRLNLVAALMHEPEIVLLDEPTVGIDPQSRNRIFEAVLDLGARGVTMLYTTHYMEEASRLCDTVAIMDHGKLLLVEPPRQMVARLGSYRIDLTVDAFPEALVADLRGLPGVTEVSHEEGRLVVAATDDGAAMGLVQRVPALAEAHGVSIRLGAVVEPSLESVFLSLTGRELRDRTE